MKFLAVSFFCVLALLLLTLTSAKAAGSYSVTIGDDVAELVFVPGPFGPGEMGTAELMVNGRFEAEYSYSWPDDSPVITVYGLGTFFYLQNDDALIFYKDLLGLRLRPSSGDGRQ